MSAVDTPITPSTNSSYTLANGGSYVINGNYSVSNYSITLSSGSATLTVNGNVTINDSSNGKSPIAVNGGTLKLIVNGTLTVYGGNAQASTSWNGNTTTWTGGILQSRAGGYAGVYVPAGSNLVIAGRGTLYTYGGNGNYGGAGAGIGGGGGIGYIPGDLTQSSLHGGNGGNAGFISILSGAVYAYGGSAGIGQTVRSLSNVIYAPITGSGYPAAGIGGGGGGGGSWGGLRLDVSVAGGGGGFNGGAGGGIDTQVLSSGVSGRNGGAGVKYDSVNRSQAAASGGGYFETAANCYNTTVGRTSTGGVLGGGSATTVPGNYNAYSGQGGAGGAGGSVTASAEARVTAYNGNYNSTSPANAGYQTPIYAQLGYTAANIRTKTSSIADGYRTATALPGYLSGLGVSKTVETTSYGLGIGAGAGYTEGGNGGYTVQSAKPGTPKTIASANGALGVYGWTAPELSGVTDYQVNVYGDEGCTLLVKSAMTGNTSTWSEEIPFQVTDLLGGTTYYVKVMPFYGGVPGTASEAASGMPYGVDIAPAAGSYYKKVEVTLTGAGVKETGSELVYSVDGGNKWSVYPASGLMLTADTTLAYGIRMGDGTVLKVGERAYVVSQHAVTFTSLTLHNSANGTGGALSMGDISGLTGQITAKLSGVVSYTSDAGYIVLAVYGENGKMERMTLTPIGGRNGDVVSKAVQLPGGMTSAYAVRAFVLESFADVAPVGKVVGIGKECMGE